ncbi:hypothetical protein LTR05_004171 [Lithohypha guttulata]|uniref:Uncharacterized protein n=1 Tax=Lithohypha guttulata TaxID=1690604 RepID=A0AAN7YBM0_9EURO|nr:hypothetical protein LTR05_004171 [Lithohypha guttulata]
MSSTLAPSSRSTKEMRRTFANSRRVLAWLQQMPDHDTIREEDGTITFFRGVKDMDAEILQHEIDVINDEKSVRALEVPGSTTLRNDTLQGAKADVTRSGTCEPTAKGSANHKARKVAPTANAVIEQYRKDALLRRANVAKTLHLSKSGMLEVNGAGHRTHPGGCKVGMTANVIDLTLDDDEPVSEDPI